VSDEVALINVNSDMMAVMMIQHSKVSDEVALFNVNSHMIAVMMIQHSENNKRLRILMGQSEMDNPEKLSA
jgi:hypothetical protein